MEVKENIAYDVDKSSKRMDEIFDSESNNYTDSESIPSRSSLTYENGYYVDVTALFIDIVDSSDMTDDHKRPVLAKLYRCFISECTAIMNSSSLCEEININGDCVWGVFNTPYKSNIDDVFFLAAELNSMVKILNYKLRKKGYSEINVGIGIDDGRALMVKAGFSGSKINDVIWMGDVVNSACHYANQAGRNGKKTLIVSSRIYSNLNEDNKKLLTLSYFPLFYEGNVFSCSMDDWYVKNCT